ncbi:hypothetical protein BRD09_06175 [Halobacteriales archaeon SW_10_68_16]|nr:MAG: hypothetical protein BRD09_06175 [Halobacteriales archaeon SW_10_68_16]
MSSVPKAITCWPSKRWYPAATSPPPPAVQRGCPRGMATSTTLRHVLVVSDVPPPDAPASGLGFDDDTTSASVVSPDEDLRERLASAGADCLLVDVDPDESRSVLSTLRAAAPETPAVVFAADPDEEFVTATLDAGATDVVQSRLAATPPELVRHRVESAIDAGPPTRAREGRLYEGIVETTGVTAAVYDEQGRFVVANSRLAELYGTTPEALRGEPSHLLSTIRERAEEGDPFADLVAGRSGGFRTELELDYPTQEGRVTDVRLSRLAEDGEFLGVAAIGRDVTERRARERQIASQRDELARLDRLNAVIRDVHQALVGARTREAIETAVCERLTAAGRYRFAIALRADGEGTLVPAAWTDGADGLIDAVLPLEEVTAETSPALRAHETGTTTVPIVYGDTQYGAVTVCAGGQDAFDEREVAVLDELGETVGHAIAAAERREREETLTALYEATRELLGTETEGAVCDVVVDAASEALDLPEVGIFLFDGTENVLRPASATDELVAFYGGTDTFGPGRADSETWHAFATGETKVFDDISESERVANPDTEARSSFVRPLGEHGVFVAASTEVGAFDGSRRKLLGLLAATAETALDRVAGRADVREREQELADRSRRIERLSRVAALFEDVAGAVVRYLDAVAVDGDEPAPRAAATGSTVTVGNVTDHLRDAQWARAAADRGYQSAVAVPLGYGETTYGVAAAYATEPHAFEGTAAALDELGDLVGFAINAAETRRGVLADRVTELELRLPGTDTFVNAVADLAGEPVQYLELAPAGDGRTDILFALEDADVEAVLGLQAEFVGVEVLDHVGDEERARFRATVTGRTVASTLLSSGAVPRRVVAHPDVTVAVVELPAQRDVRVVVDRVAETYPGVELVSRRDRAGRDRRDLRGVLETELTDRQREVLTAAYESGCSASPSPPSPTTSARPSAGCSPLSSTTSPDV